MPWGDVDTDVFAAWGQWAGGIGSILAVVVALAVLIRDRRLNEERRREAEEAVARERQEHRLAQARTVVATRAMVPYDYMAYDGRGRFSARASESVGVEVTNHGTRPVLEVWIENVQYYFQPGDTARQVDCWFGQEEPRHGRFLIADVLGPRESAAEPHLVVQGYAEEIVRTAGQVMVTFSYLDAEGYRWKRVGVGTPVRIGEPDAT